LTFRIERIINAAAFSTLIAEKWDTWAAETPGATAMQRWAWVSANVDRVPGGMFIGLVVYDTQNEPVAAVALKRSGPGVLVPVGDGVSDYLDIAVSPTAPPTTIDHLVDAISELAPAVHFRQCHPHGHLAMAFRGALEPGEVCPVLALAATADEQQLAIPKRLRQNLNYAERALRKQASSVTYRIADQHSLAGDIDACIRLHQDRWRRRWMPGLFAGNAQKEWFTDISKRLLDAGLLRLHTLSVDDKVIAAIYCMASSGTTIYYLGGFDQEYHKWSPGMLTTRAAMMHAISIDKSHTFDFLRGNEPYKYRWGAIDRPNLRLLLGRGLLGNALCGIERQRFAIELSLKDRMHSLHAKKQAPSRPESVSDKIDA
jgi:CelD/BcsL family acetyltransferase involved in cellulose biosynthesis